MDEICSKFYICSLWDKNLDRTRRSPKSMIVAGERYFVLTTILVLLGEL